MNNDLISRSALLKNAYVSEMWNRETQKFDLKVVDVDDVITAPTVDAEPVRHGRWMLETKRLASCSICGMLRDIETQTAWEYCPNCGAKMMDGDVND